MRYAPGVQIVLLRNFIFGVLIGDINLEPDPLAFEAPHLFLPAADDGPITTATKIEVAPEDQIRFFRLMKKIRLVFLRNGAFSARLDQDMYNPNRFRLQAMYPVLVA
jgi:hypothetical protein